MKKNVTTLVVLMLAASLLMGCGKKAGSDAVNKTSESISSVSVSEENAKEVKELKTTLFDISEGTGEIVMGVNGKETPLVKIRLPLNEIICGFYENSDGITIGMPELVVMPTVQQALSEDLFERSETYPNKIIGVYFTFAIQRKEENSVDTVKRLDPDGIEYENEGHTSYICEASEMDKEFYYACDLNDEWTLIASSSGYYAADMSLDETGKTLNSMITPM